MNSSIRFASNQREIGVAVHKVGRKEGEVDREGSGREKRETFQIQSLFQTL